MCSVIQLKEHKTETASQECTVISSTKQKQFINVHAQCYLNLSHWPIFYDGHKYISFYAWVFLLNYAISTQV